MAAWISSQDVYEICHVFIYIFLESWHRGASCFGGGRGIKAAATTAPTTKEICVLQITVWRRGVARGGFTPTNFCLGPKKEKCVRLNYCVWGFVYVYMLVCVFMCSKKTCNESENAVFVSSLPRSFIHGENKVIITVTVSTTRCKFTPLPSSLCLLSAKAFIFINDECHRYTSDWLTNWHT